jgi:hypothetical protein
MRLILLLITCALVVLGSACKQEPATDQNTKSVQKVTARHVEIREVNGKAKLYRHGEPYFINGGGGSVHFDKLKEFGGNSIRVWSTDNAQQILDSAHALGLTVTLGLPVAHERHGFNYKDKAAVALQLEKIREEVLKYKDHPALLMWGIGNEMDMLTYNSFRVWRAVNEIAAMIHAEDPNHPTTTMLSQLGKRNIWSIRFLAPHIDIISINTFGDLPNIPEKIRDAGWKGGYVVTEWGPTGFWEAPRTAWDVAIEQTSTQKAWSYRTRYEKSIQTDQDKCFGSYVFYWGQKQERTESWFSLFTTEGTKTEIVDVMQYLWTGKWPENRTPSVESLLIDGKTAYQNVMLDSGAVYKAKVIATDPENDPIFYYWKIVVENTGIELGEGGDTEKRPEALLHIVQDGSTNELEFKAPPREGAYRLFVWVYDENSGAATANIPFYVVP